MNNFLTVTLVLGSVLVASSAQAQEREKREVSTRAPGVQVTLGLADILAAGAGATYTVKKAQVPQMLKAARGTIRARGFESREEIQATIDALERETMHTARRGSTAGAFSDTRMRTMLKKTDGIKNRIDLLKISRDQANSMNYVLAEISREQVNLERSFQKGVAHLKSPQGAFVAAVTGVFTADLLSRLIHGTDSGLSPVASGTQKTLSATGTSLYEFFTTPVRADVTAVAGANGK